MGLRDTIYFDEDAYRRKNEKVSSKRLRKKYRQKITSILSTCFGMGVGVASASSSGGVSLVGTTYLLRQTIVLVCQAWIIKKVLRSRGNDEPRIRKRDILAGFGHGAVSLVSGLVVGTEASALITNFMSEAEAGITTSGATVALYHGAERLMRELSEVVAKFGVGPVGLQDAAEACSKAIGLAIGKAGGLAAGSAASGTVRAVAAGGSAASGTVRAVADKVLGNSCKNVK